MTVTRGELNQREGPLPAEADAGPRLRGYGWERNCAVFARKRGYPVRTPARRSGHRC
jgi:hypothetical protein